MTTARDGDRSLSIEGVLCVVYAGLAVAALSRFRTWDPYRGPAVLAFLLCCLFGFGLAALNKARICNYRPTLIEILVLISIAGVLIGLAMPPVSGHGRRPARSRQQILLRQIGLGGGVLW